MGSMTSDKGTEGQCQRGLYWKVLKKDIRYFKRRIDNFLREGSNRKDINLAQGLYTGMVREREKGGITGQRAVPPSSVHSFFE